MEDRAVLRDFEQGRGRRIVVMILAILALVIVIGAVVKGFRGQSPSRGAGALSNPGAESVQPGSAPPAIPSRE
jgi:hypothetical protein